MTLQTHLDIDNALCGRVTYLQKDYAEVLLHTTQQMSVDTYGLVHGGFVFAASDYAAMAAVNDPYVVLGSSLSRFISPVKVGDVVLFKANVLATKGRKKEVTVEATVDGMLVYEGSFTTFVLEKHVLED